MRPIAIKKSTPNDEFSETRTSRTGFSLSLSINGIEAKTDKLKSLQQARQDWPDENLWKRISRKEFDQ